MRPTLAILACTLAAAVAVPAAATTNFDNAPSGAHYRSGYSEPTCEKTTDQNGVTTVTCGETAIAGVGNLDGVVRLSLTGDATVRCRNNGGQIVDVKTQTTSLTSPNNATQNRNGTLYVSEISTSMSLSSLTSSAVCPNRRWTKELLGTPTFSWRYTLTFDGFGSPVIELVGS